MKRFLIVLLILSLVFSACSFIEVNETTTEYYYPYVTDINGNLVPVHENVNEATLDAKLYSFDENGRVYYSDSNKQLLHGIDVSVFQGEVDWHSVKADGIDFVMLRIGFRGYGSKGIINIDNNFYTNFDGAKNAGLKVGVYFYSQALNIYEAREEAAFVISTLQGRKLDFPIAYDWEYVDNAQARTKDMTSEAITQCAIAFCEYINSAGYNPIIYFNREIGYFEYDLSAVNNYDFWLAEYSSYPTFLYEYKIWQYTDSGKVNGISGNVDLNVSAVDYSVDYISYG